LPQLLVSFSTIELGYCFYFYFNRILCRKNARVGDIRIVLPIKLAVKDTSEVDKMKRELESKKRAIVEYEINIDKMLLAINMRRGQIEKAKKQVEEGCY
jgi:hypothetical protein